MFLFILFFQPFSIRFTDLNSVLIFNAGFGAIVFLLLYFIHILSRAFLLHIREVLSYFNGFALLLLSSLAFTFYLRYVGHTTIGFYTVLKIILVCMVPPLSLRIYHIIQDLKQENDVLWKENAHLQNRLQDQSENPAQKVFEFYSAETNSEILKLPLADIVLIKSADNYVEIYYREINGTKKKLIRNTLKNIEQMLKYHNQFIRCHRTCIINTGYIEKLQLKINSSYVILRELSEHIPVSRPYVIKLKEAATSGKA